jgi:hypothetical protein
VRFRVEYHDPAELLADQEEQFVHGGLLVRGDAPPGLTLFEPAELELVIGGESIVFPAQVVQILPGIGVAVTFAVNDPRLAQAIEAARSAEPEPEPEAPRTPSPAEAQAAKVSLAQKIHIALHGNRDERATILRDINKQLHPYVLRNPGLQLDEIAAIAKMSTVSPDLLKQICDRREWSQRPEVAIALVRNPKVPVPIAVRLVEYVAPADLRQLAKDSRVRDPISRAARKKLLGE